MGHDYVRLEANCRDLARSAAAAVERSAVLQRCLQQIVAFDAPIPAAGLPCPSATVGSFWSCTSHDCGRRLVRPDEAVRLFIVGSGNTTAFYGQYPWQARLVVYDANARGYIHHCGGIIISHEHVVTAAHCVVEVVPHRLLVRVGDLRIDSRELYEQEFAVASYQVHNRFGTEQGLRHDVALVRLRRRVGPGIEFGRYVQPACLPAADAEYETFLPCEVSGWGRTSDGAPISEVLRGVSVSGRFVAYGVVSSGDPLGCGRRPGLYTKLSAYVGWLLRRLQLDQEEDAVPSTAVTSTPEVPGRPEGDLGRPCFTPDGVAGFCFPLRDCPDLLPARGGNRQAARSAGCGRTSFSPPQLGAAFAKNAANFPWLVAISDKSSGVRGL
ncbi:chymotrypsin-C-like [Pollicipes pollicipes]|uniref:chymotrypsin-C-like n=1 Tax=Pollicipes pollicipes TaxID=41117 RepID=UPI0018849EE9|nr:chymotrypsin-C-like [Pollicipes pollicipes]